ncbi:signal recognition particle-docking protein FtsY [Carboxydochorda subterranea]|uniref:Signal recognition particle receptor FtsY n=1 Tax=Carboxydichorda subterranea TaxID=3109565 RepID=A0ABZ1C228_9FIRM|nr:signal recognition particle-docking protein FtsY [Limnochorda sp. L945t]WRP18918.1 signal recognition particle-docking protein FtsY [Limnochorda sp. L945t]
MSLWQRMREGMSRTRDALVSTIDSLVRRHGASAEMLEALEESLIEADIGPRLACEITGRLRQAGRLPGEAQELRRLLATILVEELSRHTAALELDDRGGEPPRAVLLVGVNGSGKTTTAGKLAWQLRREGKRVILVGADTFRAAAQDQLALWAQRARAELVRGAPGQDPASVAFDGVKAAQARKADAVIIDTAGRLHNKSQLMAELSKVRSVTAKALGRAPDEVLLVLDATTGQNGLQQARVFLEAVSVTGLVMTKLDGTARGGIAFAIVRELDLPLKLVGIGEDPDDLRPFDPAAFVEAILDVAPSS